MSFAKWDAAEEDQDDTDQELETEEIKMKKVCPDVDMCGISENIVEMKEELMEESMRSKQEEQSGIIEKKLSLLFENR